MPLVSVVIVNYNGRDFVSKCVESIVHNGYKNYEVIVVDNGSSDDTLPYLHEKYDKSKSVRILELEKNKGPAGARNEGVKIANGKYIGFLDNDTEVDPNWITEAVGMFAEDDSVGVIQCKLLLNGSDHLDCTGEFISRTGFLIQRSQHQEKDRGQYDNKVDLLAAKSAGMFIRRDVFEEIGGFDEAYFIYMEETDLCWRSWLNNHKTVFCPTSVVHHLYSTTKEVVDKNRFNYLVRFHGTKNYIMTLVKNLGFLQLIYTLPLHLLAWISFAFFLTMKGNFKSGFNIGKGICWSLFNVLKILRKRRQIQSSRVLSDKVLLPIVMKKEGILAKARKIRTAQKLVKTTEN